MRTVLIFVLTFFVGGCAYIDQNLRISPNINIESSSIGAGKKIGLRVIDDRQEQLIGKRSNAYGIGMGKISTSQDLATVLKASLTDGLRKKGFEPVDSTSEPTMMKVELRALTYETAVGLWTGGNIGTAAVKVIATNALGKTYEQAYRGQEEIRTAFVGSQETNAKVVNGALSDAVNKVFKDGELLKFLVQ